AIALLPIVDNVPINSTTKGTMPQSPKSINQLTNRPMPAKSCTNNPKRSMA
ncbi:hypothetical protein D018_1461B, partial [Vibrio parahaemolyticus VP2007-007]